jgi:hypothetical protein
MINLLGGKIIANVWKNGMINLLGVRVCHNSRYDPKDLLC